MRRFFLILLTVLCAASLSAQGKIRELLSGRAPEGFVEKAWTVDGVKRTALVRVPAGVTGPSALVFCWHGHGGRSAQAAGRWGYDQADTTSILVFPQGLPTVSPLVDKEGRMPGWQTSVSSEGGRDLRFFDVMLADLKKEHAVDERRIYSMGHSNGAAFSYLLWQARPEVLAAIGSVAGSLRGDVKLTTSLPVLHVAGEKDPLVKFAWQKATFAAVRRQNGCSDEGRPWAKEGVLEATLYPSTKGAPLVTAIHAGGHEYAKGSSELIARFFKENPKPAR
ncbi:MAG: esterase [Verrucomicrobia bacterium]|nr:esterase [Verrucomicrobiota bacterium]